MTAKRATTAKKSTPITPQSFYLESTTKRKPTTKKQSQKVSKEYYYKLVEHAPEGIIVLNLEGEIEFENKAAARLLKIPHKNLKDHTRFEKYLGRSSRKKLHSFLSNVKKGKVVSSDELNVLLKASALTPIDLVISPLKQNNKIVKFHLLIRDISQRKEEAESMREEDKMKAIKHFISGAAQEIHHPISGLYKSINSLVDKYKDRNFEYIGFREFQDMMRTLTTMRDQVRYCYDTTERMINLNAKRVGIKSAHTDVNKVIRDGINNIKHQFELTDISIRFREGRNLKPAAIISIDFTQAINSVMTNAIQSLPGSGVVQIRTAYSSKKDMIIIECKDNGVGIPKESQPHIFEPFFTTKQRGVEKNSGLGLAIVHNIITSYKGKIEVKSNLRQGTSILISLPVYSPRRTTKKRR